MLIPCESLSGLALDYAVAVGQEINYRIARGHGQPPHAILKFTRVECPDHKPGCAVAHYKACRYSPSTNWEQGGEIIEQFHIATKVDPEAGWVAKFSTFRRVQGRGIISQCQATGPTLLIAAMRCYVLSVFGIEVEIPEELVC